VKNLPRLGPGKGGFLSREERKKERVTFVPLPRRLEREKPGWRGQVKSERIFLEPIAGEKT